MMITLSALAALMFKVADTDTVVWDEPTVTKRIEQVRKSATGLLTPDYVDILVSEFKEVLKREKGCQCNGNRTEMGRIFSQEHQHNL